MSGGTRRSFCIDAGAWSYGLVRLPVEGKAIHLIPDHGEYAVSIERYARQGATGPAGPWVPDEVFQHLFAYELLERMREQERCEDRPDEEVLVLPFWPEAVFQAAGAVAGGVHEIQALFTRPARWFYVRRSEEVLEREAKRVMGDLRFEPAHYLSVMDAFAAAEAWNVIEGGDAFADPPSSHGGDEPS